MAEYFEWFPISDNDSIILGDEDYILRSFDGTGSTRLEVQSQKSPFQIGETFLNVDSQPRRVLINLRIAQKNINQINYFKNKLARKMVSEPVRIGRGPLGLLRYHREGFETVQLAAIPIDSPIFTQVTRRGNVVDADLEFYAPDPYWNKVDLNTVTITGDPEVGLEFPFEFPFEFLAGEIEVEIVNDGDVSTPAIIRVFGELETFTISNLTTGESIRVFGSVLANQYIEINTAFGEKSISLYEDAQFIGDVFDRIDIEESDFFRLETGINIIRLEAVTNVSGSAVVIWQEKLAGV